MERVLETELDPGEDGTYWTRNDEPFTGVVFSMFEGRLAGEWTCREGFLWGPERHYNEDGLLRQAEYYLAGHIHGFRRQWSFGGKYVIEEDQFGVKVRGRWWG